MISNFNQGDFFQIISDHSEEKIWQKCSREDFTTVWSRLICWLSSNVLTRRWIMSGVTKPWTVLNFGNILAMTIFFVFKMLKIWCRFHKWNKKPRKYFLFLRELDLNRERQILTIRNRIVIIDSPCVNKQPYDFKLQLGRYFQNHFWWQWWKNLVKLLSWGFYYCFEPFNMLTVAGCFETALNSESREKALDGR